MSFQIVPEQSGGLTRKESETRITRASTIAEGGILSTNNNKELSAKEKYIESIKRQRARTIDSAQFGGRYGMTRKSSGLSKSGLSKTGQIERMPHKNTTSFDAEADKKQKRMRKLHGELFQILVTLLMQDGPFLILRLVLLIEFKVATEMHILFMAKNAMVCTLLVYRLCILTCRADSDDALQKEEAASKLHNVQLAVMGASIMRSNASNASRKQKAKTSSR